MNRVHDKTWKNSIGPIEFYRDLKRDREREEEIAKQRMYTLVVGGGLDRKRTRELDNA